MQKIFPFLWFNNQAEEAVNLYTSVFKNSSVGDVMRYPEGTPGVAGQVMTVDFKLAGQDFNALNGGPEFNFTPASSFFVTCESEEQFDSLYQGLSQGAQELMPLGAYPFSKKFVWLNDRFGVSWQLSFAGEPLKITPFLMFVGDQHGRAEEAIQLYTRLFKNSRIELIDRFGPEAAAIGEKEGTVMHARFVLDGVAFMAMDSAQDHRFNFTEAVSYFVRCEDQAEVDYFWNNLTSDGGEESQCGWLKDKFGVSWQIVPTMLFDLMNDPNPERANRVTQTLLKMQKIDISKLKQAYEMA